MKYETYAEWGQPSIQESVEPDQPTHNPAEPDNLKMVDIILKKLMCIEK